MGQTPVSFQDCVDYIAGDDSNNTIKDLNQYTANNVMTSGLVNNMISCRILVSQHGQSKRIEKRARPSNVTSFNYGFFETLWRLKI